METKKQRALLNKMDSDGSFKERLQETGEYPLCSDAINTLQINITRQCNLSCLHCHVNASPVRNEQMSRKNMEACLEVAKDDRIRTIDVTGGAPEMHPHLEWFLREAAKLCKRLLVRTNAVILCEKPYNHFPDIYKETGAEVIVSLPNLNADKTNRMRGEQVFEKIMHSLRELNKRGYGQPDSKYILDIVHNPAGAFLPGCQQALEENYRQRLQNEYEIVFNNLYSLTNCPVGRYLEFLENSGNLEEYFVQLKQSFNSKAVSNLMCRNTISVAYDGTLYDCDFNQMLGMPFNGDKPVHIRDFDYEKLTNRHISVSSHCFTCTAGAGSSCQGIIS